MSGALPKKRVLSNIAMMRLMESDLAVRFADAQPSDEEEVDVVVTLTALDPDTVERVKALIPEGRVAVEQGPRAQRASG